MAGDHPDEEIEIVDPDVADLVPYFLQQRREDVEALSAMLAKGDYASVLRLGHNMKGTADSYGFPPIRSIGEQIERGAKSRCPAEIRAGVDALSTYLDRVRWRDAATELEPSS